MILIKSDLRSSDIHGIGLFACEAIKKDCLVWEFKDFFDLALTKEDVEKLSEAAREQFLSHAYVSKITGDYILCSDNSRFFNHSTTPNTTCVVPDGDSPGNNLVCFANRDILENEELTCDYSEFDTDPYDVII